MTAPPNKTAMILPQSRPLFSPNLPPCPRNLEMSPFVQVRNVPFLVCRKNETLAGSRTPGKSKLPPGMIRRRNNARRLVGGMRLHRGQEKRTLLDFPVTKLPAFVEEVKPPVEPFLGLNRSRPSAVPTAFKEIKLFMVTNRVVVSKKPFLLDRKDVIQREAFGEGPVKIKRALGLSLESPVVAGKVASEKGVGRLFGPDPCDQSTVQSTVPLPKVPGSAPAGKVLFIGFFGRHD